MPYRSAPLRRPDLAAPRRAWGAVVVALLGAALAVAGRRVEQQVRQRRARERAVAQTIEAAHARTIAGGRQVTVLDGGGERARVVRLPGRLVRRGTDVLRVPRVIAAPDAVALMPDGAWAIDADGQLFDASSAAAITACRRRPCVAQTVPAHGRVVQISGEGIARLEDGALARRADPTATGWVVEPTASRVVDVVGATALHADGFVTWQEGSGRRFLHFGETPASWVLDVPDPWEVTSGEGLVCARGRRGEVRCGVPRETGSVRPRPAAPDPLARHHASRAAQVALGHGQLCTVGFDGQLRCAPVIPIEGSDPLLLMPSPVTGLGAVREVALGIDAACARLRSGEVRCWGEALDHGGVVRRNAPVALAGLDAVDRLVAAGPRMCALQRGEVLCWGQWSDPSEGPTGLPRRALLKRAVTELDVVGERLCAVLLGGGVRCADGDATTLTWREPEGELPVGAHALTGTFQEVYVLDERSRAWFAQPGAEHFAFRRIPLFDGFERIVAGNALTCTVLGGRLRCPDFDDPSHINWRPTEPSWRDDVSRLQRALSRALPVVGERVQSDRPGDHPPDNEVTAGDARLYALLGHRVRATLAATGQNHCLLGESGRVACQWHGPADLYEGDDERNSVEVEAPAVVPGLDDAVELAVTTHGLACARRATGGVVCWGRNTHGALTAADHPEHDRRYGLDELLAR